MKGLLYSYITLNKHFWIGAAAVFVVVCITGFCLIRACVSPDADTELISGTVLFIQLFPLVAPLLLSEPQNRSISNDIGTRYLNYQLSSVTTHCYMLTELVKSLVATVLGIALVAAQLGVFLLADENAVIVEIFIFQMVVVIAGNAITWVNTPLTLLMKNSEKAGLVLGVVVGAALVYPMIKMFEDMDENGGMIDMYSFFNDPVKVLCVIGVCIAAYALFYPVTYKVIKRGDMC